MLGAPRAVPAERLGGLQRSHRLISVSAKRGDLRAQFLGAVTLHAGRSQTIQQRSHFGEMFLRA